MSSTAVLPTILTGGALLAFLYYWHVSNRSVPLPPGPNGLPLLGSALDVSETSSTDNSPHSHYTHQLRNAGGAFWLKFAEYNDQYGKPPVRTYKILLLRGYL